MTPKSTRASPVVSASAGYGPSPHSAADNTWFALSLTGDYKSSADLTMFGKQVVEDPTDGLLVRAKPATF